MDNTRADLPPLDDEYDVIILGTGLKSCILSGLLAEDGLKVCNLDTNNYYGGESASLNLESLYQKIEADTDWKAESEALGMGSSRSYLIDLCPKFIMAAGNLTNCLLKTKVTRYLDFRSVKGSYVLKGKKVHKVPSTAQEAATTSLMGMFQLRYFKKFLTWVADYDQANLGKNPDATTTSTSDVFKHFSLDENTQAFVGHAMALHSTDSYLDEMFINSLEKVKLYAYSVTRYGNSPYIYPVWGLAGLPEGFARLCAINGGVQVLDAPLQEITYNDEGKVNGILFNGQQVACSQMIADPSYFVGTDKVEKVGQVACWLFVLNHPIKGTDGADSAQIILPFRQTTRDTDLYISVISSAHQVCPRGMYLAMVTGIVEGEDSDPRDSMEAARKLMGDVVKDFFFVRDLYAPTGSGEQDQVFISNSFSPESHFETATVEVMDMYRRITGKDVDFDNIEEKLDE